MTNPIIPTAGFLRLKQILGDPKAGIPAIIPISRSSWYEGINAGKYPAPIKLSERCSAWRAEDIRQLVNELGGQTV